MSRHLSLCVSNADTTSSNSLLVSVDQYINSTENSSDQNLYYELTKNIKIGSSQNLQVDMNFNWSQNENYLYVHVDNLFYSIKGMDKSLNLGFKNIAWSENLNFFKSPEWQQQLERNKLHPKTGGNFGIFYFIETEGLNIDFAYAPFFLPSRGPDVQFQNGNAVTQSPWFLSPPSEVPYEGDTFATRYNLNDPKLSDFLREQTIAVKALAFSRSGFSLNMSYANKPSPRYVTDLDFQANVSDPSVPIDIFIKPRVVRHQLLSADLKYNFDSNQTITLGFLNEAFNDQSVNSESETFMQPLDQNVTTLIYAFANPRYEIAIGGIWREGGRTRSVGELATALVNQNLNYLYEQAVKFDFTYFKTWGWTINTSISYDFFQRGLLTSASLQRSFNKALFNVGFDALEPVSATDEASFIYQYRNLDRVWAGVSYVF